MGLTAPILALALARGWSGARPLAITWNVLALLDLGIAVGMGSGLLAPLLAPDLGARVPPAAAMGVFPMILVPTFAVPVSVLLHLLALARLLGRLDVAAPPSLRPFDNREDMIAFRRHATPASADGREAFHVANPVQD